MDNSSNVIEDVKHALFDENDRPQKAADGTEHYLEFLTWCGDQHSFIVTSDGQEYRITVNKEDE